MGISYVDIDTLGHLFGGILSCSLIKYSNIPVLLNFVIANGFHYMIEKTEKSVAPNGRVFRNLRKSCRRHCCIFCRMDDCVCFTI